MFDQFSIIFDRQWQSYTIALILAIGLSFAWMLYRASKDARTKTMDVCLATLIGAILIGRTVHVWLNWAFFTDRIDLIYQIPKEGGLNWQGALLGALIFAYGMARLRGVDPKQLLQNAMLILPLLSLFSWYACATAGCAYGAPVERMSDYPNFMTWLADDIYRLNMPRFATQALGISGSGIIFLLALVSYWRGWFRRSGFWWMLFLIASLSFAIAFLRGDYSLNFAGLRIGQWLDLALMLLAVITITRAHLKKTTDEALEHL